jgi:Flp pilus assembly pilin Flp
MNKKAQGITEYALVIAVVAAALLTMQAYFKRGVQSVVRTTTQDLGGFGGYISIDEVQRMADDQELDPKYGALQGYKTQLTTNHDATVTTLADGNGAKKTAINKWEDRVQDIPKGTAVMGGKVFYQELNN